MAKLDINFVRKQFPAFQSADLKGQGFFENAGGSYTCGPVIDKADPFLHTSKSTALWCLQSFPIGG